MILLLALALQEHVVVAKESDRFLAWPANHGLAWRWGDEVVIPFRRCAFKAGRPADQHAYDPAQPQAMGFARSRDAGKTWSLEYPGLSYRPNVPGKPGPVEIPFEHPDFALTVFYEDEDWGKSTLRWSVDRGRTWSAPAELPTFGFAGVCGRTDYVLGVGGDCTLFLTAPSEKKKRREGRVFAARTQDSGRSWDRLALVGDDPAEGFSIMSSSARLGERELVTALRVWTEKLGSIEIHGSADGGVTWSLRSTPVRDQKKGSPGSLIRLKDGQLFLSYPDRDARSICAKLSSDGGRTWSDEHVLRRDAGNWDIGYPRSVELADGRVLTAYYWNDAPAGERYIAATTWSPK
jgi:hypothetical protein